MHVEEIRITVPWGHLAAKIWGDQKDPIVLVFHGLMDNAGSFDRLIPLLPKSFCYFAFDLPSHGQSSHWPPFFPAYTINNIIVYRIITDYLKQDKYIMLTHSYGGQIGLLFAQLYPELVEKLIMLDTIHIYPVPVDKFKPLLKKRLDKVIALYDKMMKSQKPTYTYDEAVERVKTNRWAPISHEAAEALVHRAIEYVGDGKYVFTMDQRLKFVINPIHDFDYINETLKRFPVTCPVLIILGRSSREQEVYMKPVIEVLRRCKNIKIMHVEGDHDVHNNDPHVVAPHVSRFLLEQKAKL